VVTSLLNLENHSKTCVLPIVCSPKATKPHSIFWKFLQQFFFHPSLKAKTWCRGTLLLSKPFSRYTKISTRTTHTCT
jgi:hypothetical protein